MQIAYGPGDGAGKETVRLKWTWGRSVAVTMHLTFTLRFVAVERASRVTKMAQRKERERKWKKGKTKNHATIHGTTGSVEKT